MQEKNKKINIFFIGRLQGEKGADILFKIISESLSLKKNLHFHIFGEGEYFEAISQNFGEKNATLYGKVSHVELFSQLKNADYVFMPSKFLETFGLVALEALSHNVPVIGFRSGGLISFIPEELSLDEKNPVKSFFQIIEKNYRNIIDISGFSYEKWQENLKNLTKNFSKILLIHDYEEKIGGAEMYVHELKKELEKIGKSVECVFYEGKIDSCTRKKLFISSLFGIKQKHKISQKISEFHPDLIWSHTVLRYIGVGGMQAIKNSNIPHYITHHDLGLFCAKPSMIQSIQDIPVKNSLGSWISLAKNAKNFCITVVKWCIVRRIWKKIPKNTLHIVPSEWMIEVLKNYEIQNSQVFPHTLFKK